MFPGFSYTYLRMAKNFKRNDHVLQAPLPQQQPVQSDESEILTEGVAA